MTTLDNFNPVQPSIPTHISTDLTLPIGQMRSHISCAYNNAHCVLVTIEWAKLRVTSRMQMQWTATVFTFDLVIILVLFWSLQFLPYSSFVKTNHGLFEVVEIWRDRLLSGLLLLSIGLFLIGLSLLVHFLLFVNISYIDSIKGLYLVEIAETFLKSDVV